MNEQLKKLYHSVILNHSKVPHNFEKRTSASIQLKAYNPICGDRFDLYFDVKEEKITMLSFHGFGCSISKASTSVLVKHLEGRTLAEAKGILQTFLNTVDPSNTNTAILHEDFNAFSAAKEFPGRLKCATLGWDEFNLYLQKQMLS